MIMLIKILALLQFSMSLVQAILITRDAYIDGGLREVFSAWTLMIVFAIPLGIIIWNALKL